MADMDKDTHLISIRKYYTTFRYSHTAHQGNPRIKIQDFERQDQRK